MKRFKDPQGQLWIGCTDCDKGINGKNSCVYGARCKTKGFCIHGKLIKKGVSDASINKKQCSIL